MIGDELNQIIKDLLASEGSPDDTDIFALVRKEHLDKLRTYVGDLGKAQFVMARADDWEGLYKDGVLKEEGHRIPLHRLLDELGIEYNIRWVDDEWMEDRGNLPQNLSEVAFESE